MRSCVISGLLEPCCRRCIKPKLGVCSLKRSSFSSRVRTLTSLVVEHASNCAGAVRSSEFWLLNCMLPDILVHLVDLVQFHFRAHRLSASAEISNNSKLTVTNLRIYHFKIISNAII